jgi:transcriptional regulator with XRE-family HTH domain
MNLTQLVQDRIKVLGVKEAASFFGVSVGTVSNWATGKTPPSITAAELVLPEASEPQGELTMWQGKKLFIGMPVYRSFNADTHYTLFANYAKYGPDKIGLQVRKGTCVWEARNILIDKWLKTDAPTCIMCDDDMILPCGNADYLNANHNAKLPVEIAGLNAISRIMSHPHDKGIVGALYFGRHRNGRAQCSAGFESDEENAKYHRHEYEGLQPQRWVGTGFIRIERWVIEKFKAHLDAGNWPELKSVNDQRWDGYFTPLKVGVGEDVSFGTRCGKLGIQSYVDATLECLHCGDMSYGSQSTNYNFL